jgi:hypothetical protein
VSDKPEGVHVGDILIGTFVILFGLCFVLAGGVCATMWVGELSSTGGGGMGLVMLLVSLACVAFGLFILYHGQRIARGRYRNN